MTEIEVLIAGGGVAGLAVACDVAASGHSVCVVDPHPRCGMEASTHNSGVVHAGLYYPAGSLKAMLCVEGRARLCHFCAEHGVPIRKTGKLVVAAADDERDGLEALAGDARRNGVAVEIVDRARIRSLEPAVAAAHALWSPDTGIVDASAYVSALVRRARALGVILLPGTDVRGGEAGGRGVRVRTSREEIAAAVVVNAAGLFADDVSARLGGDAFEIWPCRGDYAIVTGAAAQRVTRPIYPLPDPSGHGLGVHVTPTTAGELWLGPTIRVQDSKTDYENGRMSLDAFFEAGRALLPWLERAALREGGSGMRAKLRVPNGTFPDFLIRSDAANPAIVHVAGIDSPGLTASLAIGRYAGDIVRGLL